MNNGFEMIPHTADIKIRVRGKTLEEFFRNALAGMFQAVGPQAPDCTIQDNLLVCAALPQRRSLELRAANVTLLVVDFLSEALYLSDVHDEAYLDLHVDELSESYIQATLLGVHITGFDVVEIKAVTYHDLEVKQVDGIWQADIVFDI